MLFPLDPATPECSVFEVLNNELLHFLQSCVLAQNFEESLFSQYMVEQDQVRSVCWTNVPTREKFSSLWSKLPEDQVDRQNLYDLVNNAQGIFAYFDNLDTDLPELVNQDLFDAFKSLTTHLFTRTKDLQSAKAQANSSIELHFQAFRQANGNTQLCYLCGTGQLSQDRTEVEEADQWRADYDHVLCKDKYPIFSVHPGNFIPTCHICNSKAKGARNLLKCDDGLRRKAFYPLPPSQECCYQNISIIPIFRTLRDLRAGDWQDPLSATNIEFIDTTADLDVKISVWKEVYKVPERVTKHIVTNFCERVASDLRPRNFDDFCAQIERQSEGLPLDYKKAEWRFWWHRVYEFLNRQPPEFLRDVWSLIEWKINFSNDVDMEATFQ